MPEPAVGADPREARLAAGVCSALLLVAILLGLVGLSTSRSFGWFAYQPLSDTSFVPGGGWAIRAASIAERAADPGFVLLAVVTVGYAWAVARPASTPWSVLFRRAIQPRLAPPPALQDPRAPRFAQTIGLVLCCLGLLLHLAGVPWALPIAAAAAFVPAFLNAAFGVCLGCRLHLALRRALDGRRGRLPQSS